MAEDTKPKLTRVLFLDDMEERHKTFTKYLPFNTEVDPVWTAVQAIEALGKGEYDQVFLDHDLSLDDIMVEPGARTKEPSGMDVVDHIMTMERPPREVFVHSRNEPAALQMERRLNEHPGKITVRRINFPMLAQLMRVNLSRRYE